MSTARSYKAAAWAALSLFGCAGEAGRAADIDVSAMELLDAEIVLGLEAADAWVASGGDLSQSEVRAQGSAALAIDVGSRVTIASAPFRFAKTPNLLTFLAQWHGPAPTGR